MKPRNTIYDKLVRQQIVRKLGLGDELRLTNIGGLFCANLAPSKTPFTYVKLHRRDEHCEIADGHDYLMVISHQMDGSGDWLPSEVQSVRSIRELKEVLREIVASSDSVVVKASEWFEHAASGLGLRHLTTEWGRL
jgi:hypothetical protein